MKKILIILLFCGFWANAQQYHDKGAKFENATSVGDTISNNTRIPIIDEFGLVNYYVDVADLLALNPVPPASDLQAVTEVGATTTVNMTIPDGALAGHAINLGQLNSGLDNVTITESQITDFKDYLRGDINDTNGANKLTLGSLEVTGQTILQNGLNMSSVPVGTSDNILTLNQTTGDVEQRVFSLGDINIANAAGTNQFPVGLGDQLRIQGSGDTSISFDGITNTININSTPGSGGGGAVTSFNGRDGAVVSQAGDYSTAMVNENTNLYFTEPRVRATSLTGLTVTNTPISSTNTFIQALGRLQGQINDREVSFSKNTAFNKNFGTSSGTVAQGNDSRINNGQTAYSWGNHASAGYVPSSRTISTGTHLSGGGDLSANRTLVFTPTVNNWVLDNEGNQRIFLGGTISTNGVLFQASASGQEFQYRNSLGTKQFWITDTGSINGSNIITSGSGNFGSTVSITGSTPTVRFIQSGSAFDWRIITSSDNISFRKQGLSGTSLIMRSDNTNEFFGTLTASNLSGTNTGDQTAGTGLSGTSTLSVTNIAAGSSTVGALRYNGTTKSAGRLYGGTSNPSNATRLNYDGHLFVSELTSIGDVTANSDKRLKKNIKRIDNALAIVQLLGGYEYDRKDVDLHQAGVIAQEVEEVFPVAVSEDANGTKSVAYNQLIALLIEAVKEQQIEIEQLKNLINEK